MLHVFNHALMITGFVFVMMLVIEYVNVLTSGAWQKGLIRNKWGQYVVAALLGAIPGCLGAFVVVGMYSHQMLTLGAVVAAMIATSGDEAFVMLAMVPQQAIFLTIGLLANRSGRSRDVAHAGTLAEGICAGKNDQSGHRFGGGSSRSVHRCLAKIEAWKKEAE